MLLAIKFLLPSQNLCFPFFVVALCAIAVCPKIRFAIQFCYFGFVLHLSSKDLNPAKTVPVSNGGGGVVVFWISLSGNSCLINLLKSSVDVTICPVRHMSGVWSVRKFSPARKGGHGSRSLDFCRFLALPLP